MTVHLACSCRGETSTKTVTDSTQRNSQPRCCGRNGTPVLYYAPVPRAANFRYQGTRYGWRLTRLKGPVCWRKPAHATGLPSRKLDAEVRDSSQSRCRPHKRLSLHNLMLHKILGLNFGKGFKHSTHRAHKVNSAITLDCVNCCGCECNMLSCTLPLRHTTKMLLH